MEVGVMAVSFGNFGAALKKSHASEKVFRFPVFANPLAIVGQIPTRERFELLFGRIKGARIDAPFAGEAFFLDKLSGGLGFHEFSHRWRGRDTGTPIIGFAVGARQFSYVVPHGTVNIVRGMPRFIPRIPGPRAKSTMREDALPVKVAAHVVELEEKLSFQQRALEELNQVVLAQQVELDRLRNEMASYRKLIEGLQGDRLGEDLPHEKPPHY